MHHQDRGAVVAQVHGHSPVAQPVKQVFPVRRLEHAIKRVFAVRFAQPLRHGQQMQVVVAQQAVRRAIERPQSA